MHHKLFFLMGILSFLYLASSEVLSKEELSETQIDQKLQAALKFYQAKFLSLEDEVNERFDINFTELKSEFENTMVEVREKMAVIDHLKDDESRRKILTKLREEYADERLYRFIDAYYYFANELEKDHAFVGSFLSMLEEILELVIQKDPLFGYAFQSKAFDSRYGLILKRVVWKPAVLKNASAETVPIKVHSIFSDASRTPVLIKLTPAAFNSLAFLRSILIHELSHVYFYKLPKFSDVKEFEGAQEEGSSRNLIHYFKQLNPSEPTFQYHLIQEYYGFKAQLMYHERSENKAYHRLDEANLNSVTSLLNWTYTQLSQKNKDFVKRNPDPPVAVLIYRFLGN